ncbi:MAG: galactokinase, partial [Gemmatimonadetes bacterium]|nr:galactokinase [Gemmatimonadota bacterium]NIQ56693.1 galactokinase [Gemmatimonadota bacterium]NIU76879.1 galactokinase [Gammaproteobacteria bacterium]NIX46262.1 galactokinase [Gemmatimonadota bacterium]
MSCGIMDQFISVLGRRDHALFLDARSLAYRHVPVPANIRVVATDTGTRRDLQSSAFNDRVAETRRAAELLGVPQLRDVPPGEFEARGAA